MRDVSKILSDSEIVKLRAMLQQTPLSPIDEGAFKEYPKMIFHADWVLCYRLIKDHSDPLVKKEALEKLRHVQVIVNDIETEEDYLADGWKNDPNDFIVEMGEADPRIPVGREGRRAKVDRERDKARELADIRRRYAELTGTRLQDASVEESEPVGATVETADSVVAPASAPAPATTHRRTVPPTKAAQVRAATQRAMRPSARA